MGERISSGAPKCPSCGRVVSLDEAFPFCSKRCRALDLGSWFDERYRVGSDGGGDDDRVNDDWLEED